MIWVLLHSSAWLTLTKCREKPVERLWACNLPVQYIFLLSRASKRWLIAYWSIWHWTSRSATVALIWLAAVVTLDFHVWGNHKLWCRSLSWDTSGILKKHSNLPEEEKVSTTRPPSSWPSLTSSRCSGCNSLVAKSTISSLLTDPLTWEIPSNTQKLTNTTQLTHQCACIP